MRRAQRKVLVTSIVLLAAMTGACAPERMAVPTDVGEVSEEIVISKRSSILGALVDESFQMGPYQVVDVHRQGNSTRNTSIAGFSTVFSFTHTTGGYAFGLQAPTGEYKGQCASQVDEKAVGFLGGELVQQNVHVLCDCNGASQVRFRISADASSPYRGTVHARGARYAIEGIYTLENGFSSSRPTGYQVRGPAPVGAVEVLGKGRVWLNRTLDPGARADLACLFAGLLLYWPPW
jgi:hypothetical protein